MDISSVRKAFDRFQTVWGSTDFWTRGNTFDACLRCFAAAKKKWAISNPADVAAMKTTVDKLVSANATYYYDAQIGHQYWADDFGWWGIAALSAVDYLRETDEAGANDYSTIAVKCWNKMLENGYDTRTTARPVPHGCANSPGNPNSDTGTKNTITNVNLLVLSIRLYQATSDVRYLAMAYAQFVWFKAWFTSTYPDYTPYLRFPPSESQIVYGTLVQERPMASPNYVNKGHPNWQPGWTWSADQGLMVSALIGLRSMTQAIDQWAKASQPPVPFDPAAFDAEVSGWIGSIGTGIKRMLLSAHDHVLREAPFNSSFNPQSNPVGDPKDYVCGRGVLLRYVAEWKSSMPGIDFDDEIKATANAVYASRDSSNQFDANWTTAATDETFNDTFKRLWEFGDTRVRWPFTTKTTDPDCIPGILQATGLDVLNAAIPLMPFD